MGPHYENFRAMVELMREREAISIVAEEVLGGELVRLLGDSEAAAGMGARARGVFEEQAGATGRSVAAIQGILDQRGEA